MFYLAVNIEKLLMIEVKLSNYERYNCNKTILSLYSNLFSVQSIFSKSYIKFKKSFVQFQQHKVNWYYIKYDKIKFQHQII